MRDIFCRLILISIVAGCFSGSALAREDAVTESFVKSLVSAINSRSIDRRKALIHPKSLACATPGATALTDEMLARQSRRAIPVQYRWTMSPRGKDTPLIFGEHFDYPVQPTHLLQLDYDTAPNSSVTIVLQAVRDGDAWREVTGCPKPATVAAATEASKDRVAREARARQLAARMPSALRGEIRRALKEGRRIDAMRSYQKASGEELTTARDVVDMVEADDAAQPSK